MDALTDHYADLLIQAKAPSIDKTISPEMFAASVWLFARAVSAERARLDAEDLQRIPTAAPAANPGERTSPAPGSPQTSGAVVGEVDEELAPFLEATKELRGARTALRLLCFAEIADDRKCPAMAVELIDGNPFCRACAWHELACIAQMESIEAARAAAFNGSTKEDKHAAAERGTNGPLPEPREPGRSVQVAAQGGDDHRGRDARQSDEPGQPLHHDPHGPVLHAERPVQRDADAGVLELAPARPADIAAGRDDVAIRGPAARKDASRDGIAPAAPEVGAQPKVEVAGHAAESVAQEAASHATSNQEVHHGALIEHREIAKGEVAAAEGAAAPRSVITSADLHEFYVETELGLVKTMPPKTGKRGRPTKAKSVSKSATVACGNPGCTLTGTVEHHNPATCPRFKPREQVTTKPEGIKRAGELAAKYEGSAT